MPDYNQITAFISRCKKSATYFMESCCKVRHPLLGIVPIRLFKYQRRALKEFRTHRFNIFRKGRQAGISTLTGLYVLWCAMFFNNKKILIVSKRDLDAKSFLEENIKIPYQNLPKWMQKIWKTPIWNEHEVGFSNGSIIRSLTSGSDTLRSNASSLNVIDEAAFCPDMDAMWAGGWSTMQHGGSCIVISTPNGMNWYYDKWTDAEDGGLFNPIHIRWWDMDWVIEGDDPIHGQKIRIAPTDGIRECKTKEEIEKWGKYWSPWLEREYKGLQAKGEAHLFRQEILGEFLGSGGTILPQSTLSMIEKSVNGSEEPRTILEPVAWVDQATGESAYIDFKGVEESDGLWIWAEPVQPIPPVRTNGRITKPGVPGHSYVMGVDIATGENNDYSAVQIFDITTMEQVAEYMGHVQPASFARMVDWLGRWYNNALANIERTGIGIPFIQDVVSLIYPNLWRQKKLGQATGPYGFPTSEQSKPTLNKALIQYIGQDDNVGYTIHSSRLLKQLNIYIRKRNRKGIDTKKTGAQEGRGNHDDLVIAAALAFIAVPDVIDVDPNGLIPLHSKHVGGLQTGQIDVPKQQIQRDLMNRTDHQALMPLSFGTMQQGAMSPEEQLSIFTSQLIGSPQQIPASRPKRF